MKKEKKEPEGQLAHYKNGAGEFITFSDSMPFKDFIYFVIQSVFGQPATEDKATLVDGHSAKAIAKKNVTRLNPFKCIETK